MAFAIDAITADTTLYAKWDVATYTVTFRDWDGSVLKTQTVNHGGAATAPADPSRAGWTFLGWDKSFLSVTSNLFVNATYAEGEFTTFTVTFNSNGGSAVLSDYAIDGGLVGKPADPTKAGHAFAGWYADAALTDAWAFATDVVTADTTLYAKWNINSYTVTFKDWDGTVLKTQVVEYGSAATAPAAPTRTG